MGILGNLGNSFLFMSNLITTKDKAISCVSGESTKEFEDTIKEHEKIVGRIVKGSAENLMVLNIALRELPKLIKGRKVGFDFGGKKEFELKRIK